MAPHNKLIAATSLLICFASIGATWVSTGKGQHGSASQTYAQLITSQSPQGYWRLGESSGTNLVDETTNNNGTLQGTNTLGASGALTGDADTCIDFGGTGGDYAEMPGSTDPTAMTFSAWVKWDGTADRSIWCRTDSTGPTLAWSHQLRVTAAGKIEAYLYDEGAAATVTVTGGTTISASTWYHVAIACTNGGTLKVYLNGVSDATPAAVITMWTGGDRWRLAQESGGGIGLWGTQIDEAALFHSELSSGQLLAQYNKGISGP